MIASRRELEYELEWRLADLQELSRKANVTVKELRATQNRIIEICDALDRMAG